MESLLGRAGGLIATDALEAAIGGLIKTVQKQQVDIQALRAELQDFRAADKETTLVARVATLERQLDELRRDVSVSVSSHTEQTYMEAGTQRMSIAGFVAAHHDALRTLEARMARVAVLDEKVSSLPNELGQHFASKEGFRQLQAAQQALSDGVAALQGVVASKADRSDLLRLSSAASELATFAEWKTGTSEAVTDLRAGYGEVRGGVDRSLETIARLSGVVHSLTAAAASKADAGDLRALSQAVDGLRASLDADVASTRRIVSEAAARLAAVEGSQEALRLRGDAAAADLSQLHGAAQAMQQELATLRAAVDSRAPASAVASASAEVTTLRLAVTELAARTQTCLRFVEWYASQGSAYEANAEVLERHLSSLALSAAEGAPQPRPAASSSGGGGGVYPASAPQASAVGVSSTGGGGTGGARPASAGGLSTSTATHSSARTSRVGSESASASPRPSGSVPRFRR